MSSTELTPCGALRFKRAGRFGAEQVPAGTTDSRQVVEPRSGGTPVRRKKKSEPRETAATEGRANDGAPLSATPFRSALYVFWCIIRSYAGFASLPLPEFCHPVGLVCQACIRPRKRAVILCLWAGGEALISCGGEEECGARYSLLLCSAGCVPSALVPSALALVFLVRGIRRNLVLP